MKFYNASIATQIPNIPGSEMVGIVKIKRTSTTVEAATELTWTTYENFTNMISGGDSSAKNYYAIDDSWNLCVSTSVQRQGESTEETLREVKIPYRTLIGQYSMPFRYLLTMLQITQNPEYVSYLCDMSTQNKQIDLMVFDTVQTSVDTVTYKYSVMEKWEEEEEIPVVDAYGDPVLDEYGDPITRTVIKQCESDQPEEKEETTVTTTVTNTVTANVTYANTWLMEIKNEYTNQSTTEYPLGEDGQEENEEDEDEPEGEEGEWRVNQSTTVKTETTKNTWTQAGSTENNGTIKENEFLGLWRNATGRPEIGAQYVSNGKLVLYNKPNSRQQASPVSNILTSTQLMFDLLEQSEDTQNYSTIMRYMLYKYTGRSYGVTQLDLDIFKKSDFVVISGNSGNRISYSSLNLTEEDMEILYKITFAERGNGTQEQQEYVVSCILNRVLYSGFPNTVREVVFQPNQFQPTRDGAYERAVPTETTRAAVQNVVQNGDTSQGALYFMTVNSANTPSQQRWLRNCIFLFNDADGAGNTHNFYTKQDALAELDQYKSYSFNGEFVEIAKACHDFLRENNYFYSSAANKSRGGPPAGWESGARDGSSTGRSGFPIPTDVLEPESKRYIDCSGYVTWVLIEAGVIGNVTWQYDSRTLLTNPMGFQQVSLSEIQPGDILVKAGHAEIYAGDGKSYNCGSTSAIRLETTTTSSGFTKAFRPNN